ncbi:tyrosine-type recombinase/integrase [Streptomyces sp. NPDC006365]|uniref:tyrosine-type recombinase/integrase n=1 Tax=Streptomyces sp. NPDC006365 TaxID=3364744 RepID=UPI0036C6610A
MNGHRLIFEMSKLEGDQHDDRTIQSAPAHPRRGQPRRGESRSAARDGQAGRHPALWVTERVGRLSPRSINEACVAARRDADLDEDLDLHCLRHSWITHATEFGYPARFVQENVGHSHASTTAIYMWVSNEYRNTVLEASLKNRLGDYWDVTP